jgi:hypothetical protein
MEKNTFNLNKQIVIEGFNQEKILLIDLPTGSYDFINDNTLTIIPTDLNNFNLSDYKTEFIGQEDYYSVFSDSFIISIYLKGNPIVGNLNEDYIIENVDINKPFITNDIYFMLGDCSGGLFVYKIKDNFNKTIGLILSEDKI